VVYIFTKSWYPTHKSSEANKIYAEIIKKYPPDKSLGDTILPLAAKATKDGIESLTIHKPKEEKVVQVVRLLIEAMSLFNEIEGYERSIEVWAGIEDVPTI